MYSQLYDLCRNIEGVMNMFSKELQLMDRNTVKYMIDELQEQLDNANEQLNSVNEQLNNANAQLADKDATIAQLQKELQAFTSHK